MKADVYRNVIKSLSAALAGGLLIFAFQNCGKAGFDDALDQGSEIDTSANKETGAPFAFNASFDQITYNSCFGAGLSTNAAFFTIKAGAYDNGGVSATPTFLNYVNSKLKPAYPATTVTVEQIKAYVGETAENASPTLQMALRTRGSPQQIRNPTGSNPSLGNDFINLMTDLTDDRIMDPIFRGQGAAANYFPMAALPKQRIMEAKLTFNADEGVAYSLRNDLVNNGMLALTYTGPTGASSFAARVPASAIGSNGAVNTGVAYGKGYNLLFAADVAPMTTRLSGGTVAPNSRNPANILVGIQEVNLENPSGGAVAGWTCSPLRRYVIVKTQDQAAYCPKESIAFMGDASYRRELELVRRHLPAEQWDVNISYRCVVPKSGSCYRNAAGTVEEPVEYNQALECYQGIQGLANPAIAKRCAQYVSICNRN